MPTPEEKTKQENQDALWLVDWALYAAEYKFVSDRLIGYIDSTLNPKEVTQEVVNTEVEKPPEQASWGNWFLSSLVTTPQAQKQTSEQSWSEWFASKLPGASTIPIVQEIVSNEERRKQFLTDPEVHKFIKEKSGLPKTFHEKLKDKGVITKLTTEHSEGSFLHTAGKILQNQKLVDAALAIPTLLQPEDLSNFATLYYSTDTKKRRDIAKEAIKALSSNELLRSQASKVAENLPQYSADLVKLAIDFGDPSQSQKQLLESQFVPKILEHSLTAFSSLDATHIGQIAESAMNIIGDPSKIKDAIPVIESIISQNAEFKGSLDQIRKLTLASKKELGAFIDGVVAPFLPTEAKFIGIKAEPLIEMIMTPDQDGKLSTLSSVVEIAKLAPPIPEIGSPESLEIAQHALKIVGKLPEGMQANINTYVGIQIADRLGIKEADKKHLEVLGSEVFGAIGEIPQTKLSEIASKAKSLTQSSTIPAMLETGILVANQPGIIKIAAKYSTELGMLADAYIPPQAKALGLNGKKCVEILLKNENGKLEHLELFQDLAGLAKSILENSEVQNLEKITDIAALIPKTPEEMEKAISTAVKATAKDDGAIIKKIHDAFLSEELVQKIEEEYPQIPKGIIGNQKLLAGIAKSLGALNNQDISNLSNIYFEKDPNLRLGLIQNSIESLKKIAQSALEEQPEALGSLAIQYLTGTKVSNELASALSSVAKSALESPKTLELVKQTFDFLKELDPTKMPERSTEITKIGVEIFTNLDLKPILDLAKDPKHKNEIHELIKTQLDDFGLRGNPAKILSFAEKNQKALGNLLQENKTTLDKVKSVKDVIKIAIKNPECAKFIYHNYRILKAYRSPTYKTQRLKPWLQDVIAESKKDPKTDISSKLYDIAKTDKHKENPVVKFYSGKFFGTEFSGMNLVSKDFNFSNTKMDKVFFDNSKISASFKGAEISSCSFNGCVLKGVDFEKAKLTNVSFEGAKLSKKTIENLAKSTYIDDATKASLSKVIEKHNSKFTTRLFKSRLQAPESLQRRSSV